MQSDPAVAIPGDRVVLIQNRSRFPSLNLDYIPGVFKPNHCASALQKLAMCTYTSAVGEFVSLNARYAWYAHSGDVLCRLGKGHSNSFLPGAWPNFLADARDDVRLRLPQYNHELHASIGWNACLVTYLPPGATHKWGRAQRGEYMAHGETTHEDHVVFSHGPVHMHVSPSRPGVSIDVPAQPGAVVILRSSDCLAEWDMAFFNNGEADAYLCTFVCVNIPQAIANRTAFPRTLLSVEREVRVMPHVRSAAVVTVTPVSVKKAREEEEEKAAPATVVAVVAKKKRTK